MNKQEQDALLGIALGLAIGFVVIIVIGGL